ncbi:FHA domain-containing protein [Synechococcus sp. EJ6-Ellesmere]|uniref:FHA domain-containing protein n=1 Tax=Synechococcus sp. EJ6-Ellesmere TaxID=2823734 RepID=UPI0020CC931B|nr:FHA domain-containing protein [Synechococcus sp. EJ6-Ellesmere]MCP9824773.1 FHA domain-containing protein [Synechococcus sp. EJ6-Ellesmere]
MTPSPAQLRLRDQPGKVARLDPARPLTIGRERNNRLCMPEQAGVSPHHAVVRHSSSHQSWVVCDWQSADGTFLQGDRLRQCRPLADGDEIRLGLSGPVLIFELTAPVPAAKPLVRAAAAPQPVAPVVSHLDIGGQQIALDQIRSATVQSLPRHPHIFSWWLLLCLGGLLLLPFPVLFWPLEVVALAGWILLGSRKEHTLTVVLRDGRAQRRSFANRLTALSRRIGIRKAIGQSLEA